MTLHNEYLTDEELEQLILDVEAGELVAAPPELTQNVVNVLFEKIKDDQASTRIKKSQEYKKRKEFAAYCIRVGMSVAAAVAFIMIIPKLPEFEIFEKCKNEAEVYDLSVWIKDEDTEMFREVIPDYETWKEENSDYPTKEEVLNDTGLLQKVFQSNYFQENENEINNFKENGGK